MAVTNFDASLPKPQSDLARELLKYPLPFGLSWTQPRGGREIENTLVKHVTDFLLELGSGFAFELESLPVELQTSLPSIEQIERELVGRDISTENDTQ